MSPNEYASRVDRLPRIRIGEEFEDAFDSLFREADQDQRIDLCSRFRAGSLKKIERYREPESLPRSEVQTIERRSLARNPCATKPLQPGLIYEISQFRASRLTSP